MWQVFHDRKKEKIQKHKKYMKRKKKHWMIRFGTTLYNFSCDESTYKQIKNKKTPKKKKGHPTCSKDGQSDLEMSRDG